MRFVFFSMNDFTREGGGTIRMLGILNELAKKGHDIVFVSNATHYDSFHPRIQHVPLDFPFSRQDKRVFQGLLGLLPVALLSVLYKRFFQRLQTVFMPYASETLYTFEYLDNSIGYVLYTKHWIKGYINDLHGVATLEFKFQANHAKSLVEKIHFELKYQISDWLDRKVCNAAEGLIFASKAMEHYFEKQYPLVSGKRNCILPYVLSPATLDFTVDATLKKELLVKYAIQDDDQIIFFGGAFKKTGGISDLITAFSGLIHTFPNARLFLLGDGPTMPECQALTTQLAVQDKVVFIGRTPYQHLRTYQDLATVIVCPDKQNVYSELIVHVKYLDALVSGKLVINGSFKSVMELNTDGFLSLTFTPSDVESLTRALEEALQNTALLSEKYKHSKSYVAEHLTYQKFVTVLET